MADKPEWVERILSDTQAYKSFMEYVDKRESDCLYLIRDAVGKDDLATAQVQTGESNCWKRLRNQLLMYEREEQQNGIIQEQIGTAR